MTDQEAHEYARSQNFEYISTSAKTGHNVTETFDQIARIVLQRREGTGATRTKRGRQGKDARQFFQRTNCSVQ